MAIELAIEFREDHGLPLRDGWRGLVDFGEIWTNDDADLWRREWGTLPVGEPLQYGCELRLASAASEDVDVGRGVLTLWSVDELRASMASGAELALSDGGSLRARGRVL
jgi:hypothetical protein